MKIEDYEWLGKLPTTWELQNFSSDNSFIFKTNVEDFTVEFQRSSVPNIDRYVTGYLYLYKANQYVGRYVVIEENNFYLALNMHPSQKELWLKAWPESKNFSNT